MPESTTPAVDDSKAADAADGGWVSESFSVASDLTPADTTQTQRRSGAAPSQPVQTVKPEDDEEAVDEVDDGEEHASTRDKATTPGEKPADGTTLTRSQKKALRYRLNERRTREAEEELSTERRNRLELERRLAALEHGTTRPVEKPTEKTAPVADRMPPHPKYDTFETEADYQAAVEKWNTDDLPRWEQARIDKVKAEVTSGVEARLKAEREERETFSWRQTQAERASAMKEKHPDFPRLVEANKELLEETKNVFLMDLVMSTEEGYEFLNDLVGNPDLTLALAELPLPSRPLRDAVVDSPVSRELMAYFATPEGKEVFMRLRTLPNPAREVGRLEARLEADRSGSATGASIPTSQAHPPVGRSVGSPRTRATRGAGETPPPFEDWMKLEDKRELDERIRRAGGTPAP